MKNITPFQSEKIGWITKNPNRGSFFIATRETEKLILGGQKYDK